MYNPDVDKLTKELQPRVLRKAIQLAWLRLLANPVKYISGLMGAYVAEKRLEMTYNGQAIVLDKALNEKWPAAAGYGGIYIDHTSTLLPIEYGFSVLDGQGDNGFGYSITDLPLEAKYGYYKADYATQIHSKIMVPELLVHDIEEMHAFIQRFRQVSKRYIIEYYL